jgi:RNA polymerase sigma factor (sigma-70 family)
MSDELALRDLIAQLREGDPTAAGELCCRYGPFLRAAIRRSLDSQLRNWFDSLDFVQDVWVSLLSRSPGRFTFDSPQTLLALLTRIAERKVADAYRKYRVGLPADPGREAPVGESEGGGEIEPRARSASPVEWAIAAEEWARLVSRVPPNQRTILERLREGYTYEEIGRLCGVSAVTVKRIVRRLREAYGSSPPPPVADPTPTGAANDLAA